MASPISSPVRIQQYDKADYLIDCSDACVRMKKYAEASRMLQRAVQLLGEIPECDETKCAAWKSSLAKQGFNATQLQQHAEFKLKDIKALASNGLPRGREAVPKTMKATPKQLPPRTEDD